MPRKGQQSPGEPGGGDVITLKKVGQRYGDHELFRDVDLSIPSGAFHFLTGPSGAGKTTLLKLCYGDLQASAGRVELFGNALREMSRDALAQARQRIGVVHQDCTFLDHLTVAENVALPYIAAGRPVVAGDRDALLAWVGLDAHADAYPPTLSGGERQRLALARAVILSPEVVLADEPTGNIDWDMSLRLLGLLVELNRMGTAVVIATHDMQLIRAAKAHVSARVLRISQGQLLTAGADL